MERARESSRICIAANRIGCGCPRRTWLKRHWRTGRNGKERPRNCRAGRARRERLLFIGPDAPEEQRRSFANVFTRASAFFLITSRRIFRSTSVERNLKKMKTLTVYDLISRMPVAVGEQVSAETARYSSGQKKGCAPLRRHWRNPHAFILAVSRRISRITAVERNLKNENLYCL